MGPSKKYVILVGDGMGDYPVEELNGRTPLEAAHTPFMDMLAGYAEMGTVKTIPEGMEAGSDVANMSLLGYNPEVCHTGRGPLEAASMGVRLETGDIAFRCNFVTVENKDGIRIMADYSAGHITTEEARNIVRDLRGCLEGLPLELYPGVSYRHLLVWKGGPSALNTTPPHDILGQPVDTYEEVYNTTPVLKTFRDRARSVLRDHPVNIERLSRGQKPVTDLWPWGQGPAPAMQSLKDRCGLSGMVISAVDLIKGIGVYAGFETPVINGATGYLDTNYEEKVRVALEGLSRLDCIYVHIEAPDETSHEGDLKKKLTAIEDFDRRVVGPILKGIVAFDSVDLLVVTDHYTPLSVRTHVPEPVPFMIVRDANKIAPTNAGNCGFNRKFCEKDAQKADLHFQSGSELFSYFVQKC
ncbi:cofactor-independent phosphoglycerate mutase [Thermodesulforhabdus norvegica]|uniref:Phosphoglycerate mutase n=1 Tax=Thermodesulforhabdus norvegica TaxID=39841 RepID=A0A1I4RAZ6_9BACT|nr:cofactor-independent phosphoglycerate mutase [Thermodesulforhabdus norvegica]SFM49474.1 phosphoglycerate mutase [Thermodesulforhabdus norvegica]